MDYVLQQLSDLDLGQILVIGAMLWVMYTRILGKMDKVEEKLTAQIQKVDDKLGAQIQKLDEKITDIDRQVCKMEGRSEKLIPFDHRQPIKEG